MNLRNTIARGLTEYSSSAYALIAANLVPLFGVLFLGWDAFAIVAIYWAENVIIGVINLLKMLTCWPEPSELDWKQLGATDQVLANLRTAAKKFPTNPRAIRYANLGSQLFLIPFFIFHYGLFCFVHGAILLEIFDRGSTSFRLFSDIFETFYRVFVNEHLMWAVAALAASHLFSFFVNYLGRGENHRTLVPLLMFQPYGRIIILHIAILCGGFFAFMFGSPRLLLIPLIAGKTLFDLALHVRQRERAGDDNPQGLPDQILGEAPN
jgi:Family of unknown function (DUF6498)